jgi:splicing factor 45
VLLGIDTDITSVVERVVLHMVSPPPPEPWKCLRAFVVFSGPAGAWRAIKELDGRYFGGRQLVSRTTDRADSLRK